MAKIHRQDNLLILIDPEVIPREKLASIDTTEEFQLEKNHYPLKKEISPSLHA